MRTYQRGDVREVDFYKTWKWLPGERTRQSGYEARVLIYGTGERRTFAAYGRGSHAQVREELKAFLRSKGIPEFQVDNLSMDGFKGGHPTGPRKESTPGGNS